VPPAVPLYRSRAEQFDDLVLEAVGRLEPRWEGELAGVEFAVQEVPDGEELTADAFAVPLARVIPAQGDQLRSATPARIVLYRRPLLARADDDEELAELIFSVVVEELAELLGVDPEDIDPGYGLP
jgi:predicted Zn-dependent protease with MMP-like domain